MFWSDCMSLSDLDEMALSCRTEQARNYVGEALACYRAGAFRASIVSTWIAVVFDLIEKIRELALSGDAAAQEIVNNLNSWQPLIEAGDAGAIKNSLEFERDIVRISNEKFGFFDGLQVLDLHRLRDDRNRCAHPTYQGSEQPYSPTAELARVHLVHALKHVLSQAPVQGKAATTQILKLVQSAYFPTNVDQAKIQLRANGLDRPKDSLVRSVTDHLLFGLLEGEPSLKGRKQTAIALRACHDMFPGLAEPRIRKGLNTVCRRAPDKDLLLFLGLQRHLPQVWTLLEDDNRERLRELIKQSEARYARVILPICLPIPDLTDACVARLSTLDVEDVGELLKETLHPAVIKRAVDIYCSSRTWDQSNSNYSRVVEPVLGSLDEAALRRILLAPRAEGADLNGAYSFNQFVLHVYQKERLPPAEVLTILRNEHMGQIADWVLNQQNSDQETDDIPF
jgi:hypothetical protein